MMKTSAPFAKILGNPLRIIKIVTLLLILTLFGWYVWTKIAGVVEGPMIILDSVTDESFLVAHQAVLSLEGTAPRAQEFFINAVPVTLINVDEFSHRVALAPGPNIIHMEATDRFDISTQKTIEVYYDRSGKKRNAP